MKILIKMDTKFDIYVRNLYSIQFAFGHPDLKYVFNWPNAFIWHTICFWSSRFAVSFLIGQMF